MAMKFTGVKVQHDGLTITADGEAIGRSIKYKAVVADGLVIGKDYYNKLIKDNTFNAKIANRLQRLVGKKVLYK